MKPVKCVWRGLFSGEGLLEPPCKSGSYARGALCGSHCSAVRSSHRFSPLSSNAFRMECAAIVFSTQLGPHKFSTLPLRSPANLTTKTQHKNSNIRHAKRCVPQNSEEKCLQISTGKHSDWDICTLVGQTFLIVFLECPIGVQSRTLYTTLL